MAERWSFASAAFLRRPQCRGKRGQASRCPAGRLLPVLPPLPSRAPHIQAVSPPFLPPCRVFFWRRKRLSAVRPHPVRSGPFCGGSAAAGRAQAAGLLGRQRARSRRRRRRRHRAGPARALLEQRAGSARAGEARGCGAPCWPGGGRPRGDPQALPRVRDLPSKSFLVKIKALGWVLLNISNTSALLDA